jgi:hypothetical protein
MDEDELSNRIRERAYRMWIDEGCPEGKSTAHWELAKMAIALEDARPEMLRAINADTTEPIEAWRNQGEFPTLTDQGEQVVPGSGDDTDS